MIVWGGFDLNAVVVYNDGGQYDPATDNWTATETTSVPFARYFHSAVWTGSEMIIWGGASRGGNRNDGGRYDPATDAWAEISTNNVPDIRNNHTAIWTGDQMVVWGGEFYDGSYYYLDTGGRYDPATDTWVPTDTSSAPSGRFLHTALWSSSEMIVWGGDDGSSPLNSGGRYDPSTDTWTPTAQ